MISTTLILCELFGGTFCTNRVATLECSPIDSVRKADRGRIENAVTQGKASILRGGALDLIELDAASSAQTQDGITTLNRGVAAMLTDNAQTRLRNAHGSGSRLIGQAGSGEAIGAYDGTVPATPPAQGGPWAVRRLVAVTSNYAPDV